MTRQVKISGAGGDVDLTENSPVVSYTFTNPIALIPIPAENADVDKANVIPINLNMVTERFDISCTLTDGFGSFNFMTGTTKFEKLGKSCKSSPTMGASPVVFWIDGASSDFAILNYSVTFNAGMKDLSSQCRISGMKVVKITV